MIRVFEAFAGIGGFRSGLERVGGFKIVGWCEIDKFAQKAYRILFDTGKEEFYEDITKIDYRTMPDFDLLVGGPPCKSCRLRTDHPSAMPKLVICRTQKRV